MNKLLMICLLVASFATDVMSRIRISYRPRVRITQVRPVIQTKRGYCYECVYPQNEGCKGPTIDEAFSKKCFSDDARCTVTKHSGDEEQIIRACVPSSVTLGCQESSNGIVNTTVCNCHPDNCNRAEQKVFLYKTNLLVVTVATVLGLIHF